MQHLTATLQAPGQRTAGAAHRFIAATEGRKADGVDLVMSGAQLARFQRNPVIMLAHDYRALPVGKAVDVRIDGPRLLMDVVFDTQDRAGAMVDRKVRDGFLNALSIGFNPLREAGGRTVEWELLEASVVGVPLDAEALVQRSAFTRRLADLANRLDVPPAALNGVLDDIVARLRLVV